MWTSGGGVCATGMAASVQYCGQTASMELRFWTSSFHSIMLGQLRTRSFGTSACGQAASEERL